MKSSESPTREYRYWLIAEMDRFYSIGMHLSKYLSDNGSFNIVRETYGLARTQLAQFYRDNYACIFQDESLYNYYECSIREFEFIDDMYLNPEQTRW